MDATSKAEERKPAPHMVRVIEREKERVARERESECDGDADSSSSVGSLLFFPSPSRRVNKLNKKKKKSRITSERGGL